MNKLISIIVPVYNVEDYLEKCLNSIVQQTYKNIEIIVVDDGSTDGSSGIIKNYSNKDQRITVISKKNGGLSSARNAGLKKARGEYICFVDSDDWISDSYVKDMLDTALKDGSDIVICNMEYIDSNGVINKYTPKIMNASTLDKKNSIKKLLLGKEYRFHATNKLFRKNLFDGITFAEGKLYEDVFTTWKLFVASDRASLLPKTLYYYLQKRTGSILNTKFNEKRFDILSAMDEILTNKQIIAATTKKERQVFYIQNIISLFSYLYSVKDKKRIKDYIKRIKQDTNYSLKKAFLTNNQLSLRDKIKFTIISTSPLAYCKIVERAKK